MSRILCYFHSTERYSPPLKYFPKMFPLLHDSDFVFGVLRHSSMNFPQKPVLSFFTVENKIWFGKYALVRNAYASTQVP